MHKVLKKIDLAPRIKLLEIDAPKIAVKAKAGQFVIMRIDEKGERFPLTLADWDPKNGMITIVFLEVGVSTIKLGAIEAGENVRDILGPLGNPSDIKHLGSVAVVCGGVGTAAAYPIAKALKKAGNQVVSIIGAKTEELLILEDEMRSSSDELYISTDDGSKGHKGFVSEVLETLIETGYRFDLVYAIGPPLMMKATVNVTKHHSIKTIVSLNPIMVDGMGMCGACRVTVDGRTKFACLDGPEFDGNLVDFDELIKRLRAYLPEEKQAMSQLDEM
ncbi:MAG: sulfide/dihydroorotate dehydrogenase-like FAD/NAD-binding protein [Candidatus Bathyarchaeota archaeon]|nr:MAG: sulfide/dihydroorotate dehydrogenase-like FAD/NAD-binding protein [Candidatus Bathyarchaeota archaeon]